MAKTSYSYPSEHPDRWQLSLWRRFLTSFSTRKINRRRRRQGNDVPLQLVNGEAIRPLGDKDLPLIFLTHNDKRFLASFFSHYRALGVTRFICVDDGSTDGTREILLAQPDVDLWSSSIRYGEAMRGKLWREALAQRYGYGRWYLNIDSDEYLVYPGYQDKPLKALIATLEARGQWRFPGPMLDLYPGGDIGISHFEGEDARMPWEVADHFDRDGYTLSFEKRFMSLQGGPRSRMFGAEAQLMKYPLLFWDAGTNLGVSIHQPTPFERNFARIEGVLLHFKFFSDYEKKVQEAIADKQYFANAVEYRRILDVTQAKAGLDFSSETSLRYQSPEQLQEVGLVSSPFSDGE